VVKRKRITYPLTAALASREATILQTKPRAPLEKGDARMAQDFKVGDHVSWNSEAGRVRGTIRKKITSVITFKGYKVRASKEEPQYLIKSDKTDHMAMHKGSALKKIRKARK
jgi:dsDNA-specific endonuclease/ATPase MutS2